jgi:hypothetical protein
VVLALLLGTILASTDPVVLRDVLRDRRIPRSVRRTLSVEAGTNDIVVLPALLVLIAIATADLGGVAGWLGFLGQLLVLGPAARFAVGAAGSWVMGWVDERFQIRREYQVAVRHRPGPRVLCRRRGCGRGRVPGRLRRRTRRRYLSNGPLGIQMVGDSRRLD